MKSIFTTLMALFVVHLCIGQTNVFLKIDHQLGNQGFAFDQPASNNLSNPFEVTRLQYYIAEIRLVHDGGQEIQIPNTWLLVDAQDMVYEDLGAHNITTLEGIKFGIGVEAAYNNLDPSTYVAGHPLALHLPSMHWGWTAGYRFVALEGYSGSNFDELMQVHALGNANYFQTSITTPGYMIDGNLVIDLDADYERSLEDIDLSQGGVNSHGMSGPAVVLLENFRDHVFTEGDGTPVSVSDNLAPTNRFSLFPNPLNIGAKLNIKGDLPAGALARIVDISGRQVGDFPIATNGAVEWQPETSGVFMVTVVHQDQTLFTQSLAVIL
ncbi:MAG: MbnP family protein [Salibacteraceae bacterium]